MDSNSIYQEELEKEHIHQSNLVVMGIMPYILEKIKVYGYILQNSLV